MLRRSGVGRSGRSSCDHHTIPGVRAADVASAGMTVWATAEEWEVATARHATPKLQQICRERWTAVYMTGAGTT